MKKFSKASDDFSNLLSDTNKKYKGKLLNKNDTTQMWIVLVNGKYVSYTQKDGFILLDHKNNSVGSLTKEEAQKIANRLGYYENLTFETTTPLDGCVKFTKS